MKIALLVVLVALLPTGAMSQDIIVYKADGSLEANNPLFCVELRKVTNEHTPADIYPGIRDCIGRGDYERAAGLFALAGTYGRFDASRVVDRTAHQAIGALRANILWDVVDEQNDSVLAAITTMLETGAEAHEKLCADIARIGRPHHYPRYMIQHGMRAILKEQGMADFAGNSDGKDIKEDFDPEAAWSEALEDYLHCTIPED